MPNVPQWFVEGEVRKPASVSDDDWEKVAQHVDAAVTAVRAHHEISDPYLFIAAVTQVILHADPNEPLSEIFSYPRTDEIARELGLTALQRRCAFMCCDELGAYVPKAPALSGSTTPQPYSIREIVAIEDWASYRQKGPLTEYKKLVVSLGLVAGLKGNEMDGLRWSDIEIDSRGVMVRGVGGLKCPRFCSV